MLGSSEERLTYRRQAFSMDAFHKTGAIFLTITPSEEGTLSIAAISGRVCEESLRRLENEDIPDHAVRKRIAGMDPVACSEYFESVCDTLINDVIAFDRTKSLPYKTGGIFGHVKAFLGVVEAQQSGTLHLHAIVFVAGLPRTAKEFSLKCRDKETGEEYRQNLCAFVDSIISTSLPCSADSNSPPFCPNCGVKGSLMAKKNISVRAFKKHEGRSTPEPTSVCLECNSSFGASEVIRSEVQRLHDSLSEISCSDQRLIPMGSSYQETDQLTSRYSVNPKYHLWPPRGESPDSELGRMHRLFVSRVVLLTQQHNHRHVDSCFKRGVRSNGGHCRYGFPRPAVDHTQINEEFCLVLGMKEHNEYINSYNEVMATIFRTNHDIRFLLGGTADALYYVMKYVTKSSERNAAVESAIMASFERRKRIETSESGEGRPGSLFRAGRSRVNSMAVALSKMQEVPATLCALYLRRKTSLYSSHEFAKLLLGQSMAILKGQEHETELMKREDGHYIRAPQHFDYIFRPVELSHLNLVEFVSRVKRVLTPNGTKANNGRKSPQTSSHLYRLRDSHPLSKTHCLANRKVPVIPEIVGPRMPNVQASESEKEKEKIGLISLILFFPFERDTDLTQGTGSYWRGYQKFAVSGNMSECSRKMFENMQEYYISKKTSTMECKVLENLQALYTEEDENAPAGGEDQNQSGFDMSPDSESESLDVLEGISSLTLALDGFEGSEENETRVECGKITTEISVEICASQHQVNNTDIAHKGWIASDSVTANESNGISATQAEWGYRAVSKLLRTSSEDCEGSTQQCQKKEGCPHLEDEDSTTVERLKDILSKKENMDMGNAGKGKDRDEISSESTEDSACGHFPSPEEVAKKFSLNELQKKAFMYGAVAFLGKIADGYQALRQEHRTSRPLTMYLGGEGGTGKTRVIEALLFLSRSWRRPRTIRTCAPTGIAASLVRGQTVHSLLGISAGRSYNSRKKVSERVKEEHAGTLMLIVDEISMLSRQNLGAIDSFFRKVKECDLPFGGIIVIFAGDFFQISPVANEPVYVPPTSSRAKNGILDMLGYHLWQNISDAFILKKSMRHSNDHEFESCLQRVRRGVASKEDLRLLNTRVIQEKDVKVRNFGGNVNIVVRTNALRMSLNWRTLRACSASYRMKPIVCVAEVRSSCGKELIASELQGFFNLNDSQTSNLPVLLPLLPNMPVRITQNIAVDLGISNGTEGILVGVSFEQNTKFEEARFFGVDCLVCTKRPVCVFIESDMFKKTLPKRFPGLPRQYSSETLPIIPFKVDQVVTKTRKGTPSGVKISMKQFPFVPAYASTTYKVQGMTAAAVVAFPFVRGCKAPPPPAALYVVLSRVRTLSSLFLTEPITKRDLDSFVPSRELLNEEKRLLTLHEKTLKEMFRFF